MKKKPVKLKLSLEKKVITPLDSKKSQAIAGGVNSLEWDTRCCCDQQQAL